MCCERSVSGEGFADATIAKAAAKFYFVSGSLASSSYASSATHSRDACEATRISAMHVWRDGAEVAGSL